jgi:serine/threonine protein kinase
VAVAASFAPSRAGSAPRAAGYRLVRVLGEGRSAVVHLGCADTGPDADGTAPATAASAAHDSGVVTASDSAHRRAPGAASGRERGTGVASDAAVRTVANVSDSGTADSPRGGPPRTAAIKVYRPVTPAARIDAEVAALCAVRHPHLLELLDLATTDDGLACLVLERCDTGGLAQLVSDRPGISPGEAVTILAPLVAAVAALHEAGYAHRDIRLSNVLFSSSGAPVLCGFGEAVETGAAPTPAGLAAHDVVIDDRRQLLLVVRAVLERCDEPLGLPLDDWLERHAPDADDFVQRLSEAIFEIAEPQPVRLRERAGRPAATVARAPAAAPVDAAPARPAAWRSLLSGVAWAARHARGVRRRYWTIAGGVAACLVVALFAVPQGQSPQASPPSSPATSSPSEAAPAAGNRAGAQPEGDEAGRDSRGVRDGATPEPGDEQPAEKAVLGDDPVAALVELLAQRERCVRDLSVLCLEAVLQEGSAALDRDTALIRAVQAGGEQTADATVLTPGPVLVERLGDSALLDLGDVPHTQPASALVMRGEAGWRIRDYLYD